MQPAMSINEGGKPMSIMDFNIGEINLILKKYSEGADIHDADSCNLLCFLERITGETYLRQDTYEAQVNSFLQGKVLTIIDAAIHEERANKAIKDLIKGVFREQYKNVFCSAPIGSASIDPE